MSSIWQRFCDEQLRNEVKEEISKQDNEIFYKNFDKANQNRKMGNEHYAKSEWAKALDCYNKAILYCPIRQKNEDLFKDDYELTDNLEFAMCLANRSAVLLKFGEYHKCLDDIELALQFGYPSSNRKKLLLRKQECERKLSMTKNEPLLVKSSSFGDETSSLAIHNSINQNGISLKVEKQIVSGTTLFKERAFASLLDENHLFEHCSHCFRCLNSYFFPCRGCALNRYCSRSCCQQNWVSGHGFECNRIPLIKRFLSKSVDYRLLCLATRSWIRCMESLDDHDQFVQLNSGSNQICLTIPEMDSLAKFIFYLTEIKEFRQSSLVRFINEDSRCFAQKFEICFAIVKRHSIEINRRVLANRQINANTNPNLIQSIDEQPVALGIFIQYSALLHDCQPNSAIQNFVGNEIAVINLRKVDAGEFVTVSRRDITANLLMVGDRKQKLNRIGIECKCHACEGNVNPDNQLYRCIHCNTCTLYIDSFTKASPETKDSSKSQETVETVFRIFCTKCRFTFEDDSQRMDRRLTSMLETEQFYFKQSQKARLALYAKQPNARVAEHLLLECQRELLLILHPQHRLLGEISLTLAICYSYMRLHLKAVQSGQRAARSLINLPSPYHLVWFNNLVDLVNIQLAFIDYVKSTNKKTNEQYTEVFVEECRALNSNIRCLTDMSRKLLPEGEHRHRMINRLQQIGFVNFQ